MRSRVSPTNEYTDEFAWLQPYLMPTGPCPAQSFLPDGLPRSTKSRTTGVGVRCTIHVNFGAPSEEFLTATEALGFELTEEYNANGEREQISGRYLMAPQGKMTLRYGEIRVQAVERVRDDSAPL